MRAARTVYGGRVRPGSRPDLVTLTLIGINVVVFVITAASGANLFNGGTGTSSIYDHFALIPPAVGHGQWWRLFSAAFLHYGIFHIGFNMWALYVVGRLLEPMLGRLRFIVLYVLSGVGGSLLSVLLGPLNEQAAGASGAIFGLFGALFIVARHLNLATNGIVITIVANLIFTFAVPNIDWRGHVGGLVVGTVVALILSRAPASARARVQAVGIVGVAAVMSVVGVLAVHRVNSDCHSAVSPSDRAYCAYYDPGA